MQGAYARVWCSSSALNHIVADIARCGEFFNISLGWFDCTKPSPSTSLQGKLDVKDAYALVGGSSSASNLLKPS